MSENGDIQLIRGRHPEQFRGENGAKRGPRILMRNLSCLADLSSFFFTSGTAVKENIPEVIKLNGSSMFVWVSGK